jgi:prepilin peptidase CpaA
VIAAALLLPFALLLIVAAVKDALTMKIPNWISLALVGAFAVIAPFLLPPAVLGMNLLIGLGALVVGFAFFALKWLGGGDAKLLAASSLWVGWSGLPEFLIWTALAGGALALALMTARKAAFFLPVVIGEGALGRLLAPEGDMPYGVAIAVGGLAAFPSSAVFLAASLAGG